MLELYSEYKTLNLEIAVATTLGCPTAAFQVDGGGPTMSGWDDGSFTTGEP